MSEPAFRMPNDPYELACDQAIAMCSGSTRGAIKALIMANEFLETEVAELQAALSRGRAQRPAAEVSEALAAAPRDRADWYD